VISPITLTLRAASAKWPWLSVEASMTVQSEVATQSGYGEVTATERRWTDQEKSELASSTGEAGEPDRRDPVEGRRWRI
jgi:hypothetical protein